MDIAEKIQIALYKKSGVASKNTDPDFLSGYGVGRDTARGAEQDIHEEWKTRGRPTNGELSYPSFCEWKRGYWASRLQRACLTN